LGLSIGFGEAFKDPIGDALIPYHPLRMTRPMQQYTAMPHGLAKHIEGEKLLT
jgi:hypothetical protein